MTTHRLPPLAGLLAAAVVIAGCGGRSSTAPPSRIPALSGSAAGTSGAMGLPQPAILPGRVEYRVEGALPALAAHATAYRLAATTTDDRVGRLARALGLDGAVTGDSSGWSVTGSGSVLTVRRSAGLPWTLAQSGSSGISSSGCAVAVPGGVSAPGSAPGSAPAAPRPPLSIPPPAIPPVPCPVPTAVPGLPSRADAEQRARTALTGAGLDLGGATVASSGGVSEWFVSVSPAVGGVSVISSPWSVTVGPHAALLGASGWLAGPAGAGDYPLVGVTAGLDRLRQGGAWTLRGGPGPVPMMGVGNGATGVSQALPPVAVAQPTKGQVEPATPLPGAPVPAPSSGPLPPVPGPTSSPAPPPVVVTVTGVHLGLGWGYRAGGTEAWLVPVYVFELGGGGTVPVIAVSADLASPVIP
ncbi:MAG TPA: hypothetical protein VGL20_09335 [Candidatus Dormibacteraeota bacterium]|jgi:hypothetical protein